MLNINKPACKIVLLKISAYHLLMNIKILRACQGGILATGAPIGWLLIQYLSGNDLATELGNNLGLYAYMLFGTQAVFITFSLYLGRQEQLISELAVRDSLTGIYNRRFIIDRLKVEISTSKRYKTPLSIIYFDIDHFKTVNDQYGHPAGDDALRQLSSTINGCIRPEDFLARVGGEEFLLLLPRCDLENAKKKADSIRKVTEKLAIHSDSKPDIHITISLGVATLQDNETLTDFYKRADLKLYQAKDEGRNRVAG